MENCYSIVSSTQML